MLAPAFEAVTSNPGTGETTHSFTSPAITDANYAIVAMIYCRAAEINSPTCTFDGVALTRISWHSGLTGGNYWGEAMWRIANPGASKNIVVAWGVSGGYHVSTCRTYKNVGLGDPHGAVNTATGVSASPSVNVASSVDELVLDIANQNSSNFSVGAGQTSRHEIRYEAVMAAGSDEPGSAGSTTMSWTTDQPARRWVIAGVSLKPQLAGNQIIWMMCRIRDFFKELKLGRIPANELLEQYGELLPI